MDDNKVIHAFPVSDLPENLVAIESRPAGVPLHCAHNKVTLNEHDRVVNCTDCGATLEAFNFLLSNARTLQMAWRNHAEAARRVAELNQSIAVLAKEEKRLRAQVRRLKDKPGVVLDVRGKPEN
jgi:hypothetical protein